MKYTDGLETTRLISRFVVPEDAALWIKYFNDPVNCTFIPNTNMLSNEERAKEWIGYVLKRYDENRLGMQALIHKDTGEFIGMCGLMIQEVSGRSETEVGYHLLRKHWGKGYASEAAQKFMDYGFENNMADSIVSIIHPLNFLSKNVAMRNGMSLSEKGGNWREQEVDVFRITLPEWEKLKR